MHASPSVRVAVAAACVALVSALAPAGRACAQGEPTVRDQAAARALFRQGVECADRHDWACAADRFGRAHSLRPSPVLAFNLGNALVMLGRLVEGAEHLRQVERDEGAAAPVRADARRVIAAIERRIGRLTLHVDGSLEGVQLTIDGHELPPELVGAPAPADPGEHVIEARRGEALIASARVTIAEAGSAEARLEVPQPREEESAARGGATTLVAASEVAGATAVRLGAPGALEVEVDAGAAPAGGDDAPWIALGIGAGVLLVAGAVVLGVALAMPPQEPVPFTGTLPTIEVGR